MPRRRTSLRRPPRCRPLSIPHRRCRCHGQLPTATASASAGRCTALETAPRRCRNTSAAYPTYPCEPFFEALARYPPPASAKLSHTCRQRALPTPWRAHVAPAAKGAGGAGARPSESGGEGYPQADHRGRRHAPFRRRAGLSTLPQPLCTTHVPVLTPCMHRRRRYWRSWRTISCSAGRATRRGTASGS